MNLFGHFTTAISRSVKQGLKPLFAILPLALSTPAWAQADAPSCEDLFGIAPSVVQVNGGNADMYGQWWFVPYAGAVDTKNRAPEQSLPLTAANSDRFLGNKNDHVIIRWRSAIANAADFAKQGTYLIVRNGETIKDMNGKTVGHFTRLIAKGRWDANMLVDQPDDQQRKKAAWVAPIKIEQTNEEVDSGDRVIPRTCLSNEPFKNTVVAYMKQRHNKRKCSVL